MLKALQDHFSPLYNLAAASRRSRLCVVYKTTSSMSRTWLFSEALGKTTRPPHTNCCYQGPSMIVPFARPGPLCVPSFHATQECGTAWYSRHSPSRPTSDVSRPCHVIYHIEGSTSWTATPYFPRRCCPLCDSEELQDKALDEYKCILLCGKSCTADDSLENITPEKWESIREKSLKWRELDKFQHVHENVDWEKGPKGHHMHSTCYASLFSKLKLCQAEQRKQKSEEHLDRNEASDQQDTPPEASAPKRLPSSICHTFTTLQANVSWISTVRV
ncbi:hypothetical protein GWK47_005343 [Chionoecetes opilio]|uniref:Uncharacterized protein n=1 Tax=Chionoecetes opilio TaxID=41210 RepID=A0A8J4YI97_CHIOP|nr:hypothetical protein GWK47_005343 [Chionoecetes opilio]